jgi:hypothetical protein
MDRTRIGNVVLVLGLVVFLFVLVPLGWHLGDIRSSPRPDPTHGLTVLDNCHGTACYKAPFDVLAENAIVVVVPITFILVGLGYYLTTGKRMDVRG